MLRHTLQLDKTTLFFCVLFLVVAGCGRNSERVKSSEKHITVTINLVGEKTMREIFEEIKTPFKYGVVLKHPDPNKMIDSPTIFRFNDSWHMTYIVFDGKGYETWMAKSEDLLSWDIQKRILAFSDSTWDANQKAGYMSLVKIDWAGRYEVEHYKDRHWMTYLGGNSAGYEAGTLKVGLAFTTDLAEMSDWQTMEKPILSPDNQDVRWFENKTIYKSLVIRDEKMQTGFPFVMYYNAKGDTADFESIGMAVSEDMLTWKRFQQDPVITKYRGICGDAQIARFNDIYIMFYFGAHWKEGAFERFACSYDLVNWTDWKGEDLISSSEDYDRKYAHKPWVIKWNGVVYHFYNAVGEQGRVIALATSKDIRKHP